MAKQTRRCSAEVTQFGDALGVEPEVRKQRSAHRLSQGLQRAKSDLGRTFGRARRAN